MSRLPPAEKLPLAVRKNVRDEWDNKKEEVTKEISDVLGTPWTIEVDPLALYPYAEEGNYARQNLGGAIYQYMTGAAYQLQQFINQFKEDGKEEINTIASAHIITIDIDVDKKFNYCGCKVDDERRLVILFAEGNLAVNINDALATNNLTKALNEAPSTGGDKALSYVARENVTSGYKPKIGETETELARIFGKKITVDPNFEETFAKLKASPDSARSWEERLGDWTRLYFEGVAYQLTNHQFDKDDMLQEALAEAVEKDTIRFRIVDKLSRSYNEVVFEDGALYIQTTPEYFGTNVNDAAEKIIDLL